MPARVWWNDARRRHSCPLRPRDQLRLRDVLGRWHGHRLSAIAAWVQNDYGEGNTSRKFFRNHIPPEQDKAAKRTQLIIEKSFRTYVEHSRARDNPSDSLPEVAQRIRLLGSLAIGIQWVPSPDAAKAEASFFKINQQGTPLDRTESRILKAKGAANGVASRAIVRNATGHEYWSFPEHKEEIEKSAKEIYATLFNPPIPTPIRTVDLPPAGRGYGAQTLPLTFDLVNLANDVPVIDATKKKDAEMPVDTDGTKTVKFLTEVRRVSRRISGLHPSSLGLHPAIYFYSTGGRHQPTAFYAMVALLVEWEKKKGAFESFTNVRAAFEDFLKKYKTFVNQVTGRRGSGAKGYAYVRDLFAFVLSALHAGNSNDKIVHMLREDSQFNFLSPQEPDDEDIGVNADNSFSKSAKSAAFLQIALQNQIKCAHCNALIGPASVSMDHIIRKQDGGSGLPKNAQPMHPFCNSTLKN